MISEEQEGMITNRDDFIKQLIFALEQNDGQAKTFNSSSKDLLIDRSMGFFDAEKDDQSLFVSLTQQMTLNQMTQDEMALYAYEKLQFDYPQIEEQYLMALSEKYMNFEAEQSQNDLLLTRQLIDGIVYLNDASTSSSSSSDKSLTRSPNAASCLAGAVMLKYLHTILNIQDLSVQLQHVKNLPLHRGQVVPTASAFIEQMTASSITSSMTTSSSHTLVTQEEQEEEGELVEKFALEEDPDDLSQVYEDVATSKSSKKMMMMSSESMTTTTTTTTTTMKRTFFNPTTKTNLTHEQELMCRLQYLLQQTNFSLFTNMTQIQWKKYNFTQILFQICVYFFKKKTSGQQFAIDDLEEKEEEEDNNERKMWTKYLYLLRDRMLFFPKESQDELMALKDLLLLLSLQDGQEQKQNDDARWICLRVFGELTTSKEFTQSNLTKSLLSTVIVQLVPFLATRLEQIVLQQQRPPNPNQTKNHQVDMELTVILAMLDFLLGSTTDTTKKYDLIDQLFYGMGILRTLVMCLQKDQEFTRCVLSTPSELNVVTSNFKPCIYLHRVWRFFIQCCMYHDQVTEYIARVQKIQVLTQSVHFHHFFPTEAILWHIVFMNTLNPKKCLWWTIGGHLFPLQCVNYTMALQQIQETKYVLETIVAYITIVHFDSRSPSTSRKDFFLQELAPSLQQVYSSFNKIFQCSKEIKQQQDEEEEEEQSAQEIQLTNQLYQLRKLLKEFLSWSKDQNVHRSTCSTSSTSSTSKLD